MGYSIKKAPETMSGKERVLRTFAFEPTDRVPIDYMANPAVHKKLCAALGLPEDDYEAVLEQLGVDFRFVMPAYTGPLLFEERPDLRVNPVFGFYTRWVENESGGYEDFCGFPLQNKDPDFIANFPVVNPDHFDYEAVDIAIKRNPTCALYAGGAGNPDIINSTGRVMGMEDTLVNLALGDEATLHYIDRVCTMELAMLERILDRAKGGIDFLWLGEDLGTQIAPMVSLELFRETILPMHKRFTDLAKSYGIPVMVHTCGSSSWAYEDFISIGVNAVDTLQPEAVNMSPAYLREHFGGRLAFHGCISTTGPLAYGSVEDIRQQVRETIEILGPTNGYMLSPSHMIQDNTPVENIIAMYQAAHDMAGK